jgi:MiaB-like tRNA modifying enzyme
MDLRVAFHTLGCKLNQLETESFADAFARSGATVLPLDTESDAELCVINTCTVTGKAEQKARRLARAALAARPQAVVLLTGCYAQVEAESLAALGERALVLPGSSKPALLSLPAYLAGREGDLLDLIRDWIEQSRSGHSSAPGADGRFAFEPGLFSFHSRPSLKIEDGCDNDCAYCRVHIARGPAVSLAASEVLARLRRLEEEGAAEAALTGVNLSQYRDGELDFPGLVSFLLSGTSRIALRLSSYEPDRVDTAFLEAFADPRVRPHVHLALQSCSDPVLKAMGRRYGRDDILKAVAELRRVRRDPFLAADVIAGFPGETEEDAASTLATLAECDLAWIHAFRFSPRPGTRAAAMPRRVPERLAGERVEALLELGKKGRAAYIGRWEGRDVEAVLESDARSRDGSAASFLATSENYLKLRVIDIPDGLSAGKSLRCRIQAAVGPGTNDEADAFASCSSR